MAEDAADLRADCSRCVGLCCAALPFAASTDFAIDKPAGIPCPNLRSDSGCSIHDRLRESGFRGCASYDCFGAGQRVTQLTFSGRDWHTEPMLAASMFAVFPVVRQLHELLAYLADARSRPGAGDLYPALRDTARRTDALADAAPDQLRRLDLAAHRASVAALLRQASRLVRGRGGADHAGADLLGADLAGASLSRADLRGCLLIAADLSGADLREADLIGADLRDADLRGTDLRGALYLVQAQLDVARGDSTTRLDDRFSRPSHWPP